MHYVSAPKSSNLKGRLETMGTSFNLEDFLCYLDSTINGNDASFFPMDPFSITTPMT